jgi:hypothetical protein
MRVGGRRDGGSRGEVGYEAAPHPPKRDQLVKKKEEEKGRRISEGRKLEKKRKMERKEAGRG